MVSHLIADGVRILHIDWGQPLFFGDKRVLCAGLKKHARQKNTLPGSCSHVAGDLHNRHQHGVTVVQSQKVIQLRVNPIGNHPAQLFIESLVDLILVVLNRSLSPSQGPLVHSS